MMLLTRVELPRQSLKQHQRNEQAGVSGIIEKPRARRKAAKRRAGRTQSRLRREPTRGAELFSHRAAFQNAILFMATVFEFHIFWSLWSWGPGPFLENGFQFLETTKLTWTQEGDSGDLVSICGPLRPTELWTRRCSPVKRVNSILCPVKCGRGIRPGLSSLPQQTLGCCLWQALC